MFVAQPEIVTRLECGKEVVMSHAALRSEQRMEVRNVNEMSTIQSSPVLKPVNYQSITRQLLVYQSTTSQLLVYQSTTSQLLVYQSTTSQLPVYQSSQLSPGQFMDLQ